MRVIKLSCVLLLLLEALLALAFLAGYHWWGGWRAGLLCAASLLVLACLPWLGDLELEYDSGPARLCVALGWWGRLTLEGKSPTPRVRVLGITFGPRRKRPSPPRPPSAPPPSPEEPTLPPEAPPTAAPLERAREAAGWAGEHLDSVIRLLLASLQASHEFVSGAKELRIRVQSPVQQGWADQAIASIVGERTVGPVELQCTAAGKRRIRVHYRTGMPNAGLLGLAFWADGRPRRLITAWKKERQVSDGDSG